MNDAPRSSLPVPPGGHARHGFLPHISLSTKLFVAIFAAMLLDALLAMSTLGLLEMQGLSVPMAFALSLVPALLVALGLSALFSRSVVAPIRRVVDRLRNGADTELRTRLDFTVSDELGQLDQVVWAYSAASEQLAQTEARFKSIAANMPGALFQIYFFDDGPRIFTLLTEGAHTLLGGVQPSQVVNDAMEVYDVLPTEARDEFRTALETCVDGLCPFDHEVHFTEPSGQVRWLHFMAGLRRTDSGDVVADGLILDITQKKRAEQKSAETEQLLTTVLQGIKAAIIIIDPERDAIEDLNPVAESLLGRPGGEIVGNSCSHFFELLHLGDTEFVSCPGIDTVVEYQEGQFASTDGHVTPVAQTILPVTIGGQKKLVKILLDITERKNLERKLSVAQKLESIGQLAAGIAHEINTPTQYIGDNVRFLGEAFTDLDEVLAACDRLAAGVRENESCAEALAGHLQAVDDAREDADMEFLAEEIPKAIGQSLEGVERVSTIVAAMKRFSHPDTGEKKAIDLNAAIENTVVVARNEWKYVADVQTDLDPDLPLVNCFPGDINQVILNILVNGAHAIGEKVKGTEERGTITISTTTEGDHAPHAVIRITDTGTGIPEGNRDRIFDPFFTTKEVGRGTGQGLRIVYDIVEKHDGTIDFTSEMGEGTTFTVRLPLADPAVYD